MYYDVLIIGAGPIGLACAIEVQKAGFSHLVVDKGCLVNSLYHYPQNMTFFSTAERLEIGGCPLYVRSPSPAGPKRWSITAGWLPTLACSSGCLRQLRRW